MNYKMRMDKEIPQTWCQGLTTTETPPVHHLVSHAQGAKTPANCLLVFVFCARVGVKNFADRRMASVQIRQSVRETCGCICIHNLKKKKTVNKTAFVYHFQGTPAHILHMADGQKKTFTFFLFFFPIFSPFIHFSLFSCIYLLGLRARWWAMCVPAQMKSKHVDCSAVAGCRI